MARRNQTAEVAPAADGAVRCRVKTPLRHDGVDYSVGDLIALAPEPAEALIAAGILEPVA